MRNIFAVFITFLMVCLIAACKHGVSQKLLPDLARADSLMYEYPDSTLRILERMSVPKSSDKFQNAAYCLLMTQAMDKNYVKYSSDSLINIAFDYFTKQDDPHWKALAFFYKGVVGQQIGEVEEAVFDYLKAATEVEKTKDYRLAFLIYSDLGVAYTYRSLNSDALKYLQKAYEYAKLSGDKAYISAALSYIARVYSDQKYWQEAIQYYKKALQAAEASGDAREISSVKGELSMIYAIIGEHDIALKGAKEALDIALNNSMEIEQIVLSIAEIYRLKGVNDSATYYCNKALTSDNIYTLRGSYHLLYILSKKQAKYAEAVDYNEKMWIWSDSIKSLERNSAIIEIQEKYNRQKVLNEKNKLQIKQDRTWKIGLSASILLLSGIVVVIYRLFRKQKQLRESKEQLCEYLETILQLRKRESFLCAELTKHIKVFSDLKRSPQFLDAVLWETVCVGVNEVYDDFEKRLHKQCPLLSEGDIRLCCLIKLRFSIPEIAIMRGVSSTSISQQKTRLKKRLTQEFGMSFDACQSLELWLWDY